MIELKLKEIEKEKEDRQMTIARGIREAKRKEEDKRIEREQIVLEAKLEEEKKKRRDEDHEKEVVAAWKRKEQKRKAKDMAEKEEFDRKYEERVKLELLLAGYSEPTIENIIRTSWEKERENRLAIDVNRTTFIRVCTKHLSIATLEHYGLPWEYDRINSDYVVIKQYISHEFQNQLFEHTKRLKNRNIIIPSRTVSGLGLTNLTLDGGHFHVIRKKRGKSKRPAQGFWVR